MKYEQLLTYNLYLTKIVKFLYFDQELGIVNWAVLGSAGGLMAALRQLWNSDETEVGNTEGRKEIARAVGGGSRNVRGVGAPLEPAASG